MWLCVHPVYPCMRVSCDRTEEMFRRYKVVKCPLRKHFLIEIISRDWLILQKCQRGRHICNKLDTMERMKVLRFVELGREGHLGSSRIIISPHWFILRCTWLCAPVIGASSTMAAAHAKSKAAKKAFHPYCWTSKERGTPALAAPCVSWNTQESFIGEQIVKKSLTRYAIQPRKPSLAPTERRPTISAPHNPVQRGATLDQTD